MDNAQIIPIIIALIASSPGIFSFVSQIRKEKIDSVKVAQDAMLSVITPMKEELARLRVRVTELECLISAKDERILELERVIVERTQEVNDRNHRIDDLETEINDLRARLVIVENHKNQN